MYCGLLTTLVLPSVKDCNTSPCYIYYGHKITFGVF
jgi:hypothetical protein